MKPKVVTFIGSSMNAAVGFPMKSLDLSIKIILPVALWPGGRHSVSNGNEYRESLCG
jgi:hypothetical protein